MKKLLLLSFLLLSVIQLQASLRQTKYRWRNDNGNENSATWIAAENTPITVLSNTPAIRLRIELDNDNGLGFDSPIDEALEYSSDGGTTWTEITGAATDEFMYATSTFVTNGAATTNQMGSTTFGTYVPGRIVTAPSATPLNLSDAERTEYEWVIKPTANAIPGGTYLFRSLNQEDVPLEYPTITISPVCSGTPTAGSITVGVPIIECHSSTTLTAIGTTVGLGISYHWQYGVNGSWTDFGTDAAVQTTPLLVQNTQFRCVVDCANSNESDTTDEVTVTILPLHIDLGNDINQCIDTGTKIVLDAGVVANNPQYLWDDGSTMQIRDVKESGTYSVKVTDQFTCVGYDTINVIVRDNPQVALGNDTSVCNGVMLPLNAGNQGISYFWNTGETTQSIIVNSPGSYNVFVTNDQACFKGDTIVVSMEGELPSVDGINISNNGLTTFHFTAVNPQHVLGFDWDFGDGSARSYLPSPVHTYSAPGNYIVVLRLSSSCGFLSDSTSAHIVGVNQLNVSKEELTVYPNPARETATILNKGALKMEQVVIYNVTGQIVYKSKSDSQDKHTLHLSSLSTGIYTIEVYTDKGTVARKLELLR